MKLDYRHVDVFTTQAYGGNSLPVFLNAGMSAAQMLRVTQELRHFEAIFLEQTPGRASIGARVFDMFEELPFAGHPLIGAAAVLHENSGPAEECEWTIDLPGKSVTISTRRTPTGYFGALDQGAPDVIGTPTDTAWIAPLFGLESQDLHPDLPPEVISTGLAYLIVPVIPGALQRARITRDISAALKAVQAQFAVLLDESAIEVRHWNNDGVVEDVATGSAAGTIGAYRLRHGLARAGETFVIRQGRFAGRPSTLSVRADGTARAIDNVCVGGDVTMVGHGTLAVRP